ncbi:MAG: polysaccharide export protein [Parvibaculaceae bacterium]|nr:polysaccharide export protein [Parvibaculaceae bacterium]
MPKFVVRFMGVIGALAVILTGCASNRVVSSQPLAENSAPYMLDSGDQLRILVFGQEDMSGEYKVDGSGFISIPLMEPMQTRGLSTQQLEAELVAQLAQTLLRNPSVSVEILSYRPFFILGEVNSSGQYPFVSGMTVQTAVAIAGGFTYRANELDVLITRKQGDEIVELRVESNQLVLPGDTILIEERFF